MLGVLVTAIVVSSVALVAVSGILALLGRDLQLSPLVLTAAIQLLLLVAAVVIGVRLASGDRPTSTVLVLSYLIAVLLVPLVGAVWALGERSRWGNAVLAVTGLVTATMTVRLWDLWPPQT